MGLPEDARGVDWKYKVNKEISRPKLCPAELQSKFLNGCQINWAKGDSYGVHTWLDVTQDVCGGKLGHGGEADVFGRCPNVTCVQAMRSLGTLPQISQPWPLAPLTCPFTWTIVFILLMPRTCLLTQLREQQQSFHTSLGSSTGYTQCVSLLSLECQDTIGLTTSIFGSSSQPSSSPPLSLQHTCICD